MSLRIQNVANILGLPPTDDKLLAIIESNKPTLAADPVHLRDLTDVYKRISMNTPKSATAQPLFDRF
jgi:hypothetical protein